MLYSHQTNVAGFFVVFSVLFALLCILLDIIVEEITFGISQTFSTVAKFLFGM